MMSQSSRQRRKKIKFVSPIIPVAFTLVFALLLSADAWAQSPSIPTNLRAAFLGNHGSS